MVDVEFNNDTFKTIESEIQKSKKTVNPEAKVKEIDAKLAKLKAQRESILAREREKERKARTHRLIQNGALAEKYLQCEDVPPESFEKFLEVLISRPDFSQFLEMYRHGVIDG
jgi:hypothetical protein